MKVVLMEALQELLWWKAKSFVDKLYFGSEKLPSSEAYIDITFERYVKKMVKHLLKNTEMYLILELQPDRK